MVSRAPCASPSRRPSRSCLLDAPRTPQAHPRALHSTRKTAQGKVRSSSYISVGLHMFIQSVKIRKSISRYQKTQASCKISAPGLPYKSCPLQQIIIRSYVDALTACIEPEIIRVEDRTDRISSLVCLDAFTALCCAARRRATKNKNSPEHNTQDESAEPSFGGSVRRARKLLFRLYYINTFVA